MKLTNVRASHTRLALTILCVVIAFVLVKCTQPQPQQVEEMAQPNWPELAGYEKMTIPTGNAITEAKVALGKQLYYDNRLSGDGNRSCYGCHLKEHGLTDGKPVAIGAFEKRLTRSSPTLWNIGYHHELYWDGRSGSLEKQVQGAWKGGNMGASGKNGAPSMEDVCGTLNAIPGYYQQFHNIFGEGATPKNVAQAVASFMRTIVAAGSAWEHFYNGEKTAFSESAQRGWEIFDQKAKCTNCHDGILLTDLQYHNVGVGMNDKNPDIGRAKVSGDEKDTGAFKTPTLLDISKSEPYFHNGSAASLEDAVDLMLKGGITNKWLDRKNLADAKKANLSDQDKADLLAFLKSLDVDYKIEDPTLPE